MTAYGLNPTFTDRETYKSWRRAWATAYKRLSGEIRRLKLGVKDGNRQFDAWFAEEFKRLGGNPLWNSETFHARPEFVKDFEKKQKDLIQYRAMGLKMMSLLDDAKERRDRILQMHRDLKAQAEMLPLDLGECRNVDFHYNKGHGEFPFLPMWTIRAKGRSFYVNDVEASVPWSTRERATGSTKGVLRFARASIVISADGVAQLTAREQGKMVDETREAA